MTREDGKTIVKILEKRCGLETIVTLDTNQVLSVWDIAWGYDLGAEFAQITTNCSPPRDELPIDSFHANEVIRLFDPETNAAIWQYAGKGRRR